MNRHLRPQDCFWLAVLALVAVAIGYNVAFAEDGGTMSEAMDSYIERWPWLKPVILAVARHVANDLDPRADPIGIAFVLARAVFPRKPPAAAGSAGAGRQISPMRPR